MDGYSERKTHTHTCRVCTTPPPFSNTQTPQKQPPDSTDPTPNPNSPSSHQNLPHAELALFRAGHDGSAEYEAYKKGRHARIGIAPVLKTAAVSAAAANGGR